MEDAPLFPLDVFSNSPFLPLFSCILVNKMHGSLGRKLNFHLLVHLKYVCKSHRMGRKGCCRLGTIAKSGLPESFHPFAEVKGWLGITAKVCVLV